MANKLTLSVDVQFVPYLLLHNLPHHPIDTAQQPHNMPDGRAKVVIDHDLHAIGDFLAVKIAMGPILFLLARKIFWLASSIK